MVASQSLPDARELLAEVFGHADFRAGQRDAVDAVLSGRDAVVLLPTGAGKSVCYQVPALWGSRHGKGTTIVVSPLIALMQDQVSSLAGCGIAAAALHSHQEADEQKQVVASFLNGELTMLYVSPERAATPSFRRLIARTAIALIAIDEAHCVSQWGHDFRPDYMALGKLREVVDAPMIGLTATATSQVLAEIESSLGLRGAVRVRTGFDRPNLSFQVQAIRTEAARNEALIEGLIDAGLRGRSGAGRAIVYCSTRKVAERVAKALRTAGVASGHYHAGRTKLARERAQQSFEAGRTRVLVATNAFGMGIDIPDIRLIVHYQTPGSVEAYYQEAGRAGRDGLPARCVLFFGRADLATQRRLSQQSSGSGLSGQRQDDALAAMERYATELECRHRALVTHFTANEEEPICGRCDVCSGDAQELESLASSLPSKPAVEALPAAALQTIVAAVDRLKRPVGRKNLAQALRGGKAKTLSRGGLLTLPEYGTLAHFNEDSVVEAIDSLLREGRLQRTGRKYPTVWIPGKPLRAAKASGDRAAAAPARAVRSSRHGGNLARALDNYRKRTARTLGWKPYMVLQRKVILLIDREEPDSLQALAAIHGLGPIKIERFGEDILSMVRKHRRFDSR